MWLWYLLCRDAAALAQFWVWLEDEIHNDVKLTEVEVADKLLEFRSKQAGFIDTSFDTISGISNHIISIISFWALKSLDQVLLLSGISTSVILTNFSQFIEKVFQVFCAEFHCRNLLCTYKFLYCLPPPKINKSVKDLESIHLCNMLAHDLRFLFYFFHLF